MYTLNALASIIKHAHRRSLQRCLLAACILVSAASRHSFVMGTEPMASFPMGPGRLPIVVMSVGGKTCHCLLDTGAFTTYVDDELRSALSPPSNENKKNGYSLPHTSIGTFRLSAETPVLCIDLDNLSRAFGTRVDAVLGMDVLSRTALSMDFDNGTIALYEPDYRPLNCESVKMYCMPRPYVPMTVCGMEALMLIDSGSMEELSLRQAMVDRLRASGKAVVVATAGIGKAEGNFAVPFGVLDAVEVSGFHHKHPLFTGRLDERMDGNAGTMFLARYNCTFLFRQNELLLSKSKWGGAVFWPPLRGMTIAEVEGHAVVFRVQPETPAFYAGIRPNDKLDLSTDFSNSRHLWTYGGTLTLRVQKAGSTASFVGVEVGPERRDGADGLINKLYH